MKNRLAVTTACESLDRHEADGLQYIAKARTYNFKSIVLIRYRKGFDVLNSLYHLNTKI